MADDCIIEVDELPSPATLIIPEDYPMIFRNPNKLYAHPSDYLMDSSPIQPELFLFKDGVRSRLFLRISIRITKEQFEKKWTTATFLLNTGACPHFYLSSNLYDLLKSRIIIDDAGPDYIKVKVGDEFINCIVKKELPSVHQPCNIMGLPMLFLLGLSLKPCRVSRFDFDENSVAHNVGTQNLEFI